MFRILSLNNFKLNGYPKLIFSDGRIDTLFVSFCDNICHCCNLFYTTSIIYDRNTKLYDQNVVLSFPLDEEKCDQFVRKLTVTERTCLFNSILKCSCNKIESDGGESEDPSKIALRHNLHVENVSENFVNNAAKHKDNINKDFSNSHDIHKIPRPTFQQYSRLFLNSAIPFILFGFMDNFFMIVFGDIISRTIGENLGLSILADAGLGNMVSDCVSISFSVYTNKLCKGMSIRKVDLSFQQHKLPSVIRTIEMSRPLGCILGCFLGMWPLLFLDYT